MNLVPLIKSLFDALTAYLQLKSKSFYYDMMTKTREKQKDYAQEIEKLRSSRNPVDGDRANVLRMQLQQEQKWAADLATFYASTSGR